MKSGESSHLAHTGFSDLESRWQSAIAYFKKRGEVIFVNEGDNFWEKHGFVQQSLAKYLTDHDIPVTWYDDFGWRPYRPFYHWNSPFLQVTSIRRFPGDRLKPVRTLNDSRVANKLVRN